MYVRAPLKCHTAPTRAKLLSFNKNGNLETLGEIVAKQSTYLTKTLASTRSHTQTWVNSLEPHQSLEWESKFRPNFLGKSAKNILPNGGFFMVMNPTGSNP